MTGLQLLVGPAARASPDMIPDLDEAMLILDTGCLDRPNAPFLPQKARHVHRSARWCFCRYPRVCVQFLVKMDSRLRLGQQSPISRSSIRHRMGGWSKAALSRISTAVRAPPMRRPSAIIVSAS